MIINEYQPVKFQEEFELCKCNSKNTQPVQDGDITQFQVEMEVCNFADNLITNGDFTDPSGDGWITSLSLTDYWSTDNTGVNTLETDQFVMGENVYYQVELDIESNNGVPFLVYFGTRKVAEVNTNGKFQLGGKCESNTTAGTLRIVSPRGNTVAVTRVALFPLETDIGLVVQSVGADGSFTPVDFRSLQDDINDANYTMFRLDRDVITVSFPWDYITDNTNGLGLSRGCYVLGVVGKCQNPNSELGVFDSEMVMPVNFGTKTALDNETFPYQCDTVNAVRVLANTGYMEYYLGGGAKVTVTDINTSEAKVGMRYSFTINVTSITAVIGKMTVSIGGATNIISLTGVHTFDLVGINTNGLTIDFEDASSNPIVVDYFRMDISNTSNLDLIDTTWNSNVFDFKETQPCTILLSAVNNEDAFGLRFESSFFVPKARMKGNLRAKNYDSEREEHIDSLNRKIIDYAEQRKTSSIRVKDVPEYLVDWLSLFYLFNKIYVDSEEYVAEEEIDLGWNRFCDTARVEIEVGEVRQDLTNTNTKGLLAVSDINNILVRVFDEEEPIIFIDGDQIALKG